MNVDICADPEQHKCREEFHRHLPSAHRYDDDDHDDNYDDKEENDEERILEKREMGIGFEDEARNGNGSKDSNWNCVEAKMNVVVETHF